AIHEADRIVATHGRGFWILDDITALRQINDEVAKADAFLFSPAEAISVPPGSENGTPMPLDEPLADNPPYGAIIDYYLKSTASVPVTLEILDPAGAPIRRYSSEDRTPPVTPDTLNGVAVGRPTPAPLSAAAGMHRWVGDLRPTPTGERGAGGGFGERGGGTASLPGMYTVKLTVNGKGYTRPFKVKMD